LGTLGLCVLELFAMYATDGRTDRRTDGRTIATLTNGRGNNNHSNYAFTGVFTSDRFWIIATQLKIANFSHIPHSPYLFDGRTRETHEFQHSICTGKISMQMQNLLGDKNVWWFLIYVDAKLVFNRRADRFALGHQLSECFMTRNHAVTKKGVLPHYSLPMRPDVNCSIR